jgi:hypothetical protein
MNMYCSTQKSGRHGENYLNASLRANRKYPYMIATTWRMSFGIVKDNTNSPQAASLLTYIVSISKTWSYIT